MIVLQHFGFSEEPFGSTPDPRCLYAGSTYGEALASLKYGFVSGRGFTALIAPPGLGKTTLLFRFLEDIRESAGSVFLFDIDNQCEPRELLAFILRDIGITPALGFAEMHEQLNGVLVAEARAGRKFVLIIDEAQNLSNATLETVRLLSNFETPRAKLMQIVLSGQPQLSQKLMQPSLVQLRQRISIICQLQPLSAEETRAYIDHRLKLAGYLGEPLFSKEALDLITQASHGIPRTINNLCFNALSLGCALKRKQVDRRIAAEAISDQQLMPESRATFFAPIEVATVEPDLEQPKKTVGMAWLWIPAAAILLIVAALSVRRISEPRNPQSSRTLDVRSTAVASTKKAIVTAPAPKTTPVAIKVAANQTLSSIAVQYLGSSDVQHMRQIQTLNPKLTHPNHIVVGQTIRLPGPMAAPVGENVNMRNLP